MGLLKKDPNRYYNYNLNIRIYRMLEYLGAYDTTTLAKRLRFLHVGIKIYKKHGFSDFQFVEFHQDKRNLYDNINYYLFLIFGFFAMTLFFKGAAWYVWSLIIVPPLVVRSLLHSEKLKANFLHTDVVLSKSDYFQYLLKLSLDDIKGFENFSNIIIKGGEINEDVSSKKQITIETSPTEDGLTNNDLSFFHDELLKISKQENKFNKMPMREVIQFFSIMCCDACSTSIPQIHYLDFISFLKMAFLKQEEGQRISFEELRVMDAYALFYEFFSVSISKGYDSKHGNKLKYSKLLSDFFNGFFEEKVTNNFRPAYGRKIGTLRSTYLAEIQKVHEL